MDQRRCKSVSVMRYSLRNRLAFTIAKTILSATIGFMILGAALFLWFGYVPADYDAATGETTYRVLLGSLQLDYAISRALGISLFAARFVGHAMVAAIFLLLAAFFLQLFLIVRAASSGFPFTSRNAIRLARMGWFLIVAFGPVQWMMWWLGGTPGSDQVILDVLFLLLGLVFLILAEVFRHGIVLREDLEGTI
ncbi:DUF2975 domain-containing protein [Qipengyuania sp. SM2507]